MGYWKNITKLGERLKKDEWVEHEHSILCVDVWCPEFTTEIIKAGKDGLERLGNLYRITVNVS